MRENLRSAVAQHRAGKAGRRRAVLSDPAVSQTSPRARVFRLPHAEDSIGALAVVGHGANETGAAADRAGVGGALARVLRAVAVLDARAERLHPDLARSQALSSRAAGDRYLDRTRRRPAVPPLVIAAWQSSLTRPGPPSIGGWVFGRIAEAGFVVADGQVSETPASGSQVCAVTMRTSWQ